MKANKRIRRHARRLFRRCFAAGQLDAARTREVAARVASSGRRESLPILRDFLRLVRLEVGRRSAVVESAEPLEPKLQDRIRAGIAVAHGDGVAVAFRVHPPLVAGMRIRVGSTIYDGSVQGRLAALQARF